MALVADYGMSSEEEEDDDTMTSVGNNKLPAGLPDPSQSDEVLEDFVRKTNYGKHPACAKEC